MHVVGEGATGGEAGQATLTRGSMDTHDPPKQKR